jgi:hypothetical protein
VIGHPCGTEDALSSLQRRECGETICGVGTSPVRGGACGRRHSPFFHTRPARPR